MKKRVLSLCLTLAMVLAFLPSRAMAAGNSYGSAGDAYAYVTSEKTIDLGEIKYSGEKISRCGEFTVTIENIGTERLSCPAAEGSSGRGARFYQPDVSIEPGESADITIEYGMDDGAAYGSHNDYIYITFDGAPQESMIQFLPSYTLVEDKSASGSGSYGGNYGDNVFVDQWGNRYLGVDGMGGSGFTGGSGSTVELGDLSIKEGEGYGFSVSPHELSFDTCFVGESPEPLYVTLTNTGDTSLDDFRGDGYLMPDNKSNPVRWKLVEGKLNSKGELDPGKSLTYELTLNTSERYVGSGTVSYEGQFVLNSHAVTCITGGGFGVGKGGTFGSVPEVLTVDYEIKPLSEVKGGDIAWEINTESVDFGTHDDTEYVNAGRLIHWYPRETKTFSVTNKGKFPFLLEVTVSDDEATDKICAYSVFGTTFPKAYAKTIKPGQTETIEVNAGGTQIRPGIAGGEIKLTAYYEESKENNTLTATIPLTSKYLHLGGYYIQNLSDTTYGRVKDSDGVDRATNSGMSFVEVKEGGSFTFVMTPYDPKNYTVIDILVDGKSVGGANTYTFTNVQESHTFEAVFGPGTDIKAPGAAEPAAWAKETVEKGIELGIIPAELQSGYDQPITRRDFCVLADKLYTSNWGESWTGMSSPFTDIYDDAVTRMEYKGVINGVGNGLFAPNDPLTREQAATILARLAGVVESPLGDAEPTFDDNADVSGWARAAVGQMQASGIMGGTGNNQFSPQGTYTREQSMVTIMRLYDIATEKLGR